MPSELLTYKEAADALGVSRQQVSALIRDDKLDIVRRGLVGLVTRESIDARLSARAAGPTIAPMPDGYMSVAEVADATRRSHSAVLGWIRSGYVQAERHPANRHRWMIPKGQVEGLAPPRRGRPSEQSDD